MFFPGNAAIFKVAHKISIYFLDECRHRRNVNYLAKSTLIHNIADFGFWTSLRDLRLWVYCLVSQSRFIDTEIELLNPPFQLLTST